MHHRAGSELTQGHRVQELTVRHRDRAGNVSAIKWPGDFDIGVRARRERVVARDQCAVRFQLKIQARRCQCRKCYGARDLEMYAGKFASKLLDRECVPRKIQARLEILDRRQRWVGHARDVDGHVAAPTENRTRDCSANIHIKRSVAVQFLDARNKLPHEIHRAARQTHLRGHRRFVGHFFFMHHLWNIERKISSQLERLNFRLLQFAGNRQLLALRLRN